MKKISSREGIAVGVTLVVVFGLLFFGNLVFQSSQKSEGDVTNDQSPTEENLDIVADTEQVAE